MEKGLIKKIYNVLIATDPVRAYKLAKNIRDNKLKEKAKIAVKTKLINMGYGRKNFESFSPEEQEKILKYLQCLEEGLLDFLEKIKKPD